MKTSQSTFCLYRKGQKSNPISKDKSKEKILELFRSFCETQPKDSFIVSRIETTTEIVVESEDYRQATFKFD